MEVRKLAFEFHDRMARPRDIARSACARPYARGSFDEGADHLGVLSHAEIII
jgi:putative hemolysin